MGIMDERNKEFNKPQNILIEDRENIKVSGVTDVESFDESEIILYTTNGGIILSGNDFKINRLSVETGEVEIEGYLNELKYSDVEKSGSGFWSKIFK